MNTEPCIKPDNFNLRKYKVLGVLSDYFQAKQLLHVIHTCPSIALQLWTRYLILDYVQYLIIETSLQGHVYFYER